MLEDLYKALEHTKFLIALNLRIYDVGTLKTIRYVLRQWDLTITNELKARAARQANELSDNTGA